MEDRKHVERSLGLILFFFYFSHMISPSFSMFFFFLSFSLFCCFEVEFHSVRPADLELTYVEPLTSASQSTRINYKCEPPHLAAFSLHYFLATLCGLASYCLYTAFLWTELRQVSFEQGFGLCLILSWKLFWKPEAASLAVQYLC